MLVKCFLVDLSYDNTNISSSPGASSSSSGSTVHPSHGSQNESYVVSYINLSDRQLDLPQFQLYECRKCVHVNMLNNGDSCLSQAGSASSSSTGSSQSSQTDPSNTEPPLLLAMATNHRISTAAALVTGMAAAVIGHMTA